MNKAFVKESDTSEANCPRCQSLGIAVGPVTLESHLDQGRLKQVADHAFFCPLAACEVAYFDEFEQVVLCDALKKPVYPKDPTAPMCACFGLTREDVDCDLDDGTPTRIRELLLKAKSPDAHCQSKSPSGQSCIAEVQRYYLRMLAQRKSGNR